MNNVLRLNYDSSISKLCEVNPSFASGVLRVAYTGRNRNGSYISKEVYERCMNTIYNCPIVCNYNRDTDSIGSHDVELVASDDGGLRMVNITTPIGVVPESARPYWEYSVDNGVEHEYLCVDVLLWKRQEAYEKICKDGVISESMEITVRDGFSDKSSGLFVINDFEFTAFCILGEGVEPCFEGASLEVFSHSEFKKQMEQMMSELKETYSMVNSSAEEFDNKESAEGGKTVEDLFENKEVEEVAEEAAVEKIVNDEEVEDAAEEAAVEDEKKEFELEAQFRENLIAALEAETVETCFGEMPRYWFYDYDNSTSMVYCYDEYDWKLYGISYSMNGDNVVLDFGSKKRMKMAIVDFDNGIDDSDASPFAGAFEICTTAITGLSDKFEDISRGYNQMKESFDAYSEEIDSLRQFKASVEAEKHSNEIDSIAEQFRDLNGIDAFENLKETMYEMDADSFEEKCYAIRGRNVTTTFSLENKDKQPVLKVEKNIEGTSSEPYGGLFVQFNTGR